MKYFLIANFVLVANWLQQGVASGEGGGRKEIDEHTDKENEKGGKSHHQIDKSLFSSLRGAYLETQSLQNPVDNVSEFGVEKGVAFTSGYFSKGGIKVTKSSSAVSTVLKPPTDYVLTFGIEPRGIVSGWNSIIHFTDGANCCKYGQRVPGIWFHGSSTKLHVSTGTSRNGNHYQDLPEGLPLNKKSLIEVRVVGSLATVAINGIIKSSKRIGSRPALDKVHVYIGDPWHPSANAIISDISFTSAFTDVLESVYHSYLTKVITKSGVSSPIATILKPPTDYVLTFEIEPRGTISAGWSSIIHFTTGENCCNYGQRVPGIWFHGSSTQLHVSTGTSSDGNHYQDLPEGLPLNKKSLIEVRVVGSLATVAINGIIKSSQSIGSRPALDKVNVYIGDPWSPSANAIISDFSFTSAFIDVFESVYYSHLPKVITKSGVSSPIATILKPPTDYVLTFEIEPRGTVSGWNSIIHFTDGENCCNYGQRVPGIWFHGSSTKLHVVTGTSSNGNHYQDLPKGLPLNKKSLIEVRVVGSLATVKINGVIHSSKSTGSRPALDKVNVYIGDPWHPSANAIISDISFSKA